MVHEHFLLKSKRAVCVSLGQSHAASCFIHIYLFLMTVGKAILLQAWTGPWGSRNFRFQEFLDIRNMKVVRLSVIRTGRLFLPGDTHVLISVRI
jgi:hypothetical protein